MTAYRRVDDLTVTCRLTACTPGSAPGPTLGIEYGKPLPLPLLFVCMVPFNRKTVMVKTRCTSQLISAADSMAFYFTITHIFL